jgi:hypothetical protein
MQRHITRPSLVRLCFSAGRRRHTEHVFFAASVIFDILVVDQLVACWAALFFFIFDLTLAPALGLLALDALKLFVLWFFDHVFFSFCSASSIALSKSSMFFRNIFAHFSQASMLSKSVFKFHTSAFLTCRITSMLISSSP